MKKAQKVGEIIGDGILSFSFLFVGSILIYNSVNIVIGKK